MYPDAPGIVANVQIREDHEQPDGWYSDAVLSMTLRRTCLYEPRLGLQLRFDVNALMHDNAVGAIANLDNEHWVALKYVNGVVWLLDSLRAPRVLNEIAYKKFVDRRRLVQYDIIKHIRMINLSAKRNRLRRPNAYCVVSYTTHPIDATRHEHTYVIYRLREADASEAAD